MSIPHSKLLKKTKAKPLSASKSIMAMASIQRDIRRSRLTNEQSQTVNINLSHPTMTRDIQPQLTPQDVQYPTPYEVSEGITVVPPTTNIPQDTKSSTKPTPTQVQDTSSDAYAELGELYKMLNNSENVAKALILIIDLIQSNPLLINKFIIPTYETFRELVCILTESDDVDIQFSDDVGCTVSKKYNVVEDIYVIKDGETQSLRYTYPEVLRLFDRFKISCKFIAVE